jgi:hypothetical protein
MVTEARRDDLGTMASIVLGVAVGLILAVPALPRQQELLIAGVSLNQAETVLVFGVLAIVTLPVVALVLSALID